MLALLLACSGGGGGGRYGGAGSTDVDGTPPRPAGTGSACPVAPCVDDVATAIARGEARDGDFGEAIAVAGGQLVVGAPGPLTQPRAVALTLPDLTPSATFIGYYRWGTGQAVAAADIDGDGVDEVAFSQQTAYAPNVYVTPTPTTEGVVELEGDAAAWSWLSITPTNDTELAQSLAFADGGAELWFESNRLSAAPGGAVYAFDTTLRGEHGETDASRALTAVDNVWAVAAWDGNADGVDDLVATYRGEVVWFEGPWGPGAIEDMDGAWSAWEDDDESGYALGDALVDVGDVDGDGRADLAITALRFDGNAGAVYIVPGGAPVPPPGAGSAGTDLPMSVTGTTASSQTGAGVAGADLDADGQQDLLVAVGWGGPGRVLAFRGPFAATAHTPDDADGVVFGADPWDLFGDGLATGDVDGDGLVDVVIGAPRNAGVGAVYVVPGGALLP